MTEQEALERARELYETTAHFYAIDRLWMWNIAAALAAAASEARAAAIAECADWHEMRAAEWDTGGTAEWHKTMASALRALATPAG